MIQIDIDMPKDCYECPLCHRAFDGNETRLACYGFGEWCLGDEGRLDNCPLHEVADTDTISRQAAIDAVRELYIQSTKNNNDIVYDTAIDQAHDALVNLPSAPQRTGHWIPMTCRYVRGAEGFPYLIKKWTEATEPDDIDGLKCSECGEIFDFEEARKWCCECGARMVKCDRMGGAV